jgi:ABC-type nitrate/sulfonate/bicarbonate transport system substrate-binding protein
VTGSSNVVLNKEKKKPFSFFRFVECSGGGLSWCCFSDRFFRAEVELSWYFLATEKRMRPYTVALLSVLLSACYPLAQPLRLGLGVWPPLELFFLARSQDFFNTANVRLELVDFSTPTDSRRAFERGQIDGFAASLDDILLLWQSHSRDARIVQVLSAYTDSAGEENFVVLVWDATVLSAREAEIRRITTALAQALNYTRADPAQAYARMAERGQVRVADLHDWYEHSRFFTPHEQRALFDQDGSLRHHLRVRATRLLAQGRLPLLLPDTDHLLAPPL